LFYSHLVAVLLYGIATPAIEIQPVGIRGRSG
jgi:hypothetical protein